MLGDIGALLRKGARVPLEPEDLPPPLDVFRGAGNAARAAAIEAKWAAALDRARARGEAGGDGEEPPVSRLLLLRTLVSTMPPGLLPAGVACGSLHGLLGTVARFVVLRLTIRALERSDGLGARRALAASFALVLFFEGALGVAARQLLAGALSNGLIARASALVMAKVSRVAEGARARAGEGEVAAFYGADFPRCVPMVRWASYLPMGALSLLGGGGVLVGFLGAGALVGVACMAGFMRLQVRRPIAQGDCVVKRRRRECRPTHDVVWVVL